jgi:hypothetical protein
MKDCVSKLIFEGFALEELSDTWLNLRHFENLMDGWPFGRIYLQDAGEQLCGFARES